MIGSITVMKIDKKFGESIIGSEHASVIAEQLGEVALDAILNEGILKEISILSTVLSIFKAGHDVSAYFFARKIINFLVQLESSTIEERESFIRKYYSVSEGQESVGESTLMLLDKMDNILSAELLGRAFFPFLKGSIDKNMFEIYSYIIKDLNPYLVNQISQLYGNENIGCINAPAAIHLSIYGIVSVPGQIGTKGGIGMPYYPTDFGKAFYSKIIKF